MYKYKLRISVYNTNLEFLSIIKLRISVFNANSEYQIQIILPKNPQKSVYHTNSKSRSLIQTNVFNKYWYPLKQFHLDLLTQCWKNTDFNITTCFLPCQCDKMIHIAWCKDSKMLIYAWCKYWLVSRMPAPHRPQPPGFFSRGTCDLSGQINFNALANWTELYFASWYVNAKEPEVMSNFMQLYP